MCEVEESQPTIKRVNTIVCLEQEAAQLLQNGEVYAGVQVYERLILLAMSRASSGSDARDALATAKGALEDVLAQQSEFEASLAYFEGAKSAPRNAAECHASIERLTKQLAEHDLVWEPGSHPETASTLLQMGDLHVALAACHDALQAQHWGPGGIARREADSSSSLSADKDFICLHEKESQRQKALAWYMQSLSVCDGNGNANSAGAAAALRGIASMKAELEEFEESLQYYERLLALYESTLGPAHPLIPLTLDNMGHVHEQQGDELKALECYRQAEDARRLR